MTMAAVNHDEDLAAHQLVGMMVWRFGPRRGAGAGIVEAMRSDGFEVYPIPGHRRVDQMQWLT